ncbi:peptidoglycan-binding protein [Candidatus Kaiserbacteria bacterium]|nr:peptidoglycan-binding protein [Candidatus Kaiserbacteria bacterium]
MFNRFVPGLLIVLIMLVGAAPVVSSALSADDLQSQIQQLLAKIQELSAQLNDLRIKVGQVPLTQPACVPRPACLDREPFCQMDIAHVCPPSGTATSTPSIPPSPPINPRVCETMTRTLAVGGQGEDVRSLQEFLREEGFLNAEATGYFGSMTHSAVAKWQTAQGVVSSDTATAAGAGVFGPKSREFLKIRCGGKQEGVLKAFPTSGQSPLAVNFWYILGDRSSSDYSIDFGDGATGTLEIGCGVPPTSGINACPRALVATHTYAANGNYKAVLSRIIDPCGGNPACMAPVHLEIIGTVRIQVGPIACTMEYKPVCGAKPIVCITTPCNPVPTTYGNKCMMNADNAALLYAGECKQIPTHCIPRPACLDTTPRCLPPEPSEGWCPASENKTPVIKEISGPTVLRVSETGTWKVRALDPQNDALSYSVTWGDEGATNSSQVMASQAAPAFTQSTSFTHSYAAVGTYTIVVIVRDTDGNEARTSTTVNVKTQENPVACTLQYDPVCGRPAGCTNTCPSGLYCAALCRLPDPVTYSNKCFMQAAGAHLISESACSATSTNSGN